MSAPVSLTPGPCEPWCTAYQVRSKPPFDDPQQFTYADVELARTAASGLMFQAGGRRWPGVCTDTVRPDTCDQLGSAVPLPIAGTVQWVPIAPHAHGFCGGGRALSLGAYPVVSVEQVRVDGEVFTGWELRDWRYLVRTDGSSWPCCNRYDLADPVLEVDFSFGTAPPPEGVMAATAVARQLLLAWSGSGDCQLGAQATSITRENVTVELASLANQDPDSVYEQIPEVMAFIAAHNPNKLRRRARFLTGHGAGVFRNTTPAP